MPFLWLLTVWIWGLTKWFNTPLLPVCSESLIFNTRLQICFDNTIAEERDLELMQSKQLDTAVHTAGKY